MLVAPGTGTRRILRPRLCCPWLGFCSFYNWPLSTGFASLITATNLFIGGFFVYFPRCFWLRCAGRRKALQILSSEIRGQLVRPRTLFEPGLLDFPFLHFTVLALVTCQVGAYFHVVVFPVSSSTSPSLQVGSAGSSS